MISMFDIFSRVQRLEDSMFTKEDAKEMKAEMKAEMKEMWAEMEERMNLMFAISTAISLLNLLLGAYNTFVKNK